MILWSLRICYLKSFSRTNSLICYVDDDLVNIKCWQCLTKMLTGMLLGPLIDKCWSSMLHEWSYSATWLSALSWEIFIRLSYPRPLLLQTSNDKFRNHFLVPLTKDSENLLCKAYPVTYPSVGCAHSFIYIYAYATIPWLSTASLFASTMLLEAILEKLICVIILFR